MSHCLFQSLMSSTPLVTIVIWNVLLYDRIIKEVSSTFFLNLFFFFRFDDLCRRFAWHYDCHALLKIDIVSCKERQNLCICLYARRVIIVLLSFSFYQKLQSVRQWWYVLFVSRGGLEKKFICVYVNDWFFGHFIFRVCYFFSFMFGYSI